MGKTAVIFDLDGVIVTTDEFHYQAWKQISKEEGLYFDREINEKLRGVSRRESLNVILSHSQKNYSESELEELLERKNHIYKKSLSKLVQKDIMPGILSLLEALKKRGIKTAIGSSSKNAKYILDKIGLSGGFNVVVDGTDIKHSKPDPEVFLLAAKRLGLEPGECVVVEDAEAGIEAALSAGMKAVGVGPAASYSRTELKVPELNLMDIRELLD